MYSDNSSQTAFEKRYYLENPAFDTSDELFFSDPSPTPIPSQPLFTPITPNNPTNETSDFFLLMPTPLCHHHQAKLMVHQAPS